MKKLNQRGLTAIEILISFVLVIILSSSMYSITSMYKNRQNIEKIKETVSTYKNLLTKEINDDLIKKGLLDVSVTDTTNLGSDNMYLERNINILLSLKNGQRCLSIYQKKVNDYDEAQLSQGESNASDDFSISYGSVNGECSASSDIAKFPLPDVGSGKNALGQTVKDLRINNVEVSTANNVFDVYIGFYHPDLGTKYAINIVSPISF